MKTIYRTSGVPWGLFFSKRFRFPQGTIIDYRFTDTRIPMRLNLRKFFTAARRIRSFRQSLTVAQNWGSEILSRFKFRENILNIAPNVLYFRTVGWLERVLNSDCQLSTNAPIFERTIYLIKSINLTLLVVGCD